MKVLAPLASKEQLIAYTRGAVSETDPRVDAVLEAVSAGVRAYCGWHIAPVITETVVLDSDGATVLVLPSLHVIGVDEVKVNGKPLDADKFEWSGSGELRRGYGWPNRWRSVEVTFEHGFDQALAVGQIVLQVAAGALASPMGAVSERAGQVQIQHSATAPGVAGGMSFLERDLQILAGYRLPGLS